MTNHNSRTLTEVKCRSVEIPYQDYNLIKRHVLIRRKNSKGADGPENMFIDQSFPPDMTSLTYVYSGDDKYDRMVFLRPKEICPDAVLAGVGGFCNASFPWKLWQKRGWFNAAVVILSLGIRCLERIMPGYRNVEQCIEPGYLGVFRFNIWRFGEWVEVVVDDTLPVLDGQLAYCPALGNPPEFWAPLLEKAYAKCNKTYEATETGRTLDALADLTGSICEYYSPDVNPPENLFHILYKSSVNRSLIVCWRNSKRLTPMGFNFLSPNEEMDVDSSNNETRYLHVITATTKFPTTDRRLVEMVRLRSPFEQEPSWHGKYSMSDFTSWEFVNQNFQDKFKPLQNKSEHEYWMALEDFRCNFGGIIIVSSTEPNKQDGSTVQRQYKKDTVIVNGARINRSFHGMQQASERAHAYKEQCKPSTRRNSSAPAHPSARADTQNTCIIGSKENNINFDMFITDKREIIKQTGHVLPHPPRRTSMQDHHKSMYVSGNFFSRRSLTNRAKLAKVNKPPPSPVNFADISGIANSKSTCNSETTDKTARTFFGRKASVGSVLSEQSTSDICLHFNSSNPSETVTWRPQSAPNKHTVIKKDSTVSMSTLVKNSFLAKRTDHFRSDGSWHQLLYHKDQWLRDPNFGQKELPRSPRIVLELTKPDAINEVTAAPFHGKSHIVVSLLQDYRRGSPTANSLHEPIGFCIYKTKSPDKDEKRDLSKLQLVGEAESQGESRKVTERFDLESGTYFIVPFCRFSGHGVEFILRVMGEKDPVANKTGCVIS